MHTSKEYQLLMLYYNILILVKPALFSALLCNKALLVRDLCDDTINSFSNHICISLVILWNYCFCTPTHFFYKKCNFFFFILLNVIVC